MECSLLPKEFTDLFELEIHQIFSEEQLQQIENLPFNIKDALVSFVRDIQLKHENTRLDYTRKNDEAEQRYSDMELTLNAEKNIILETREKLSLFQTKCSENEMRNSELSDKVIQLQTLLLEKEKSWSSKEQDFLKINSQLDNEVKDLNEAVYQKNKEIDRLTVEWKQLSERLNEAINLRLEAQSQCEEAKSEYMMIQNRESRLKNELAQATERVDILNFELQAKFEEILGIRKEKSSQLLLLQSENDELSGRLNHADQCLAQSRKDLERQEEQIDTYIRKLKEAKDGQSILEEQYRGEISAQSKLIDLYKSSLDEARSKAEEMSTAINELQRLNQECTGAYSLLKEEKEALESDLREQVEGRDEKIHALEEELSCANHLLEVTKRRKSMMELSEEEMEEISPVAAAASKLLKSGMSLTQIYTEYVKVSKELMVEKEERRKTAECLETILQDIDKKTPLLRQQKREYERSKEKIESLTEQLNETLQVASQHQANADELFRKNCELTRKSERYAHQVRDLSKQVRMLLKELEEERGTIVKLNLDEDEPMVQEMVTSSSAIISNRLVTFKSIEDLQQKNLQLLDIVRELSSAAESKESAVKDEGSDARLSKALAEIEELKTLRTKQAHLLESFVQQRDMYKAMSNQTLISSPRNSSTPIRGERTLEGSHLNETSTSEVAGAALTERERMEFEAMKTSLDELKTEFTTYRREKCEHEKMLNEDLAAKTKELTEMRLKSAKMESQLEFTKERFKVLQGNVESYKKEAELLRDRNQKISESLAKHQQIVIVLKEEMKTCQERASAAEARCNSLQLEKERLKVSEATLISEAESVRKEKLSRDVVLMNLESIKNNMERSDFEMRARLDKRIENLEKENAILRSKVDDSNNQSNSSRYILERHLKDANEEMERCKLKCTGLEEMLKSSEMLVEHLKNEAAILQKKCSEVESQLAEKQRILESNELHQLLKDEVLAYKSKFEQTTSLLKVREEELEQTTQHLTQYKEMAENLEISLKEQMETSLQFRTSLEQQLTLINEAMEETKQLKDSLEERSSRLEEENTELKGERDVLMEEMNRLSKHALIDPGIVNELEKLKEEVKVITQARDLAVSNEQLARQDLEVQSKDAQLAHNNYERELLMHAADVEQLSTLKRELSEISSKLQNEKSKTSMNNLKMESERNAWNEKEQDYNQKLTILKEKVTELQNQNTLLHEEFDKMSQKMLEFQRQQNMEFESMSAQASSIVDKEASSQKSSEQLFEVIRFLRREKEIAEVKFEGLEAETARLRKQCEHLRKQLNEAEESLVKEKEKLQIKLQTAAEHAEMLRKIESIHLLQDSNQLLRDERDRISSQMRELQMKAVELDSKMAPLEEKCMELESERELLHKEIDLAREEAGRWKTRTSNLIEQCNKFDPEEFKKAIEERDCMKIQLNSATEEVQRMRNEAVRANQQIASMQNELQTCKDELLKTREEIESSKNQFATEIEEKNSTIIQLKKIGRKYRMQSDESQKEIEELKSKVAMMNELQEKLLASEQQCSRESEKLVQMQKQVEELTARVSTLDFEAQMLSKKLKDMESLETSLNGELAQLRQEHAQIIREKSSIEATHTKLVEDIKKSEDGARTVSIEIDLLKKDKDELSKALSWKSEENVRLTEEVTKISDERTKIHDDNTKLNEDKKELEKKYKQARSYLLGLKKKIEDQKADIERLTKENEELKVLASPAGPSQEHQISLAGEKTDLMQQMEESLQNSSAIKENNERLQRENEELKQKMATIQKEVEVLKKQTTHLTGKPTLTTPPVERNILTGMASDASQRRANIRPMTCNSSASNVAHQQKYSTPVQPVRRNTDVLSSAVTMVASIRPMAVAQSQPVIVSTPMATVMPTALNIQDNESSNTLLLSQSVITSHQIMRPTQQVQPVSHTEESTVSSSGEPGGPSTSQEHAPLPVLSTAGVVPGMVAAEGGSTSSVMIGPSGVGPTANSGKRQREESRTQDESGELEGEAPPKRSKILIGEAADTTQSVAAGACTLHTLEVEREAASRAQPVDAQQLSQTIMLLRRDSEPVTTSLEGHSNYNNQEDNSRSTPLLGTSSSAEGSANPATSDELPDYQDLEYDPTNSDPTTSGQVVGDGDEQMMPIRVEEDITNNQEEEEDVIVEDDRVMDEGIDEQRDEDIGGADADVIFVEDDEEKFDNQEVDSIDYDEEQEMPQVAGQEDVDSEEREDKNYAEQLDEYELEIKHSDEFDEDNFVHEDDGGSMVNLDDDQSDTTQPVEVILPITSSHSTSDSSIQQCGMSSDSTPLIPPHYMRSAFPQVDNSQASYGQSSRSLLTSLSFPEGYEAGDDGIVPSTPTNQFSNKTDVFIEGTQSPRVEEQFPYRTIAEDHSGLAHQGDLGVDQTHIDLLDFDEGTSHHNMIENSARDEDEEQEELINQEHEKREKEDSDDDREQLDEVHAHSEHADEFDCLQHAAKEDSGESQSGSSRMLRIHERSSDLIPLDKQENQAGSQKPKIQKIVWDEPPTPVSQTLTIQPGPSQGPTVAVAGPSGVQTRRAYHQSRGGRGNVRAAVLPLLPHDFPQPVPRRGRGSRGSGTGSRRHHF